MLPGELFRDEPVPQDAFSAIHELVEALRLTVEYVGTDTLPPLEGWSWYDALKKYAPDIAKQFEEQHGKPHLTSISEADDWPRHVIVTGKVDNLHPYLLVSHDRISWTRQELNKESHGYNAYLRHRYYMLLLEDISQEVKEAIDEHR